MLKELGFTDADVDDVYKLSDDSIMLSYNQETDHKVDALNQDEDPVSSAWDDDEDGASERSIQQPNKGTVQNSSDNLHEMYAA